MNTDTTLRQVKLFQTEIIQNFDENSEFDKRVNYSLQFKGNVIRKWTGGAEYVGGGTKAKWMGQEYIRLMAANLKENLRNTT